MDCVRVRTFSHGICPGFVRPRACLSGMGAATGCAQASQRENGAHSVKTVNMRVVFPLNGRPAPSVVFVLFPFSTCHTHTPWGRGSKEGRRRTPENCTPSFPSLPVGKRACGACAFAYLATFSYLRSRRTCVAHATGQDPVSQRPLSKSSSQIGRAHV